jgi:hypothetical protein
MAVDSTASGATQLSLTDPDRRGLPQSPTVDVGDNVRIAVDRQHQRMVEPDVTHATTEGDQLSPMAMSAKEMLAVARLRTVAAMGYDRGHEITACAQAATEAYVPNPSTAANTTHGLFGPERCSDDPQKDCYRGPAGEELTCRGETPELGRRSRYYATAACRRCPLTDQCTSNTDGRRMTRWVDAPTLERMEDRRNATPAIMQERKPLV